MYVMYCIYVCVCLPHHAGSTPDVCRGTVTSSYQDFNGTVLSRLDVLCKVLVLHREEDRKDNTVELYYGKFVYLLLYKYNKMVYRITNLIY